jgi:PKD domain
MSRTSIVRTLTLTAGALAATAVAATAAPSAPTLNPLPEFNTGRDLRVGWTPATFTAKSGYRRYEISATDLTTGISEDITSTPTTKTLPALFNGHRYRLRVRASERICIAEILGGGCFAFSPAYTSGPYSDDQQTRIDATDATGTIEINGGAAFTNSRDVGLGLTATDPLSNGYVPSGVTRMRLRTGDAFPCDPAPLDTSGCLTPFATSALRILPEGPDGVRTVSAQFEDAAFPAGFAVAVGSPSGNLSSVASDTIVLDTTAPTARITQSASTIAPGGSLSLSAATSTDGTGGPADSGIDPASAAWQFGDGTTGTGMDVAHTYPTAGTYDGRATLRDRAGNSATQAFRVVVSPGAIISGARITSVKRLGAVRQFRTARIGVTTSTPSTVVGVLVKRGRGDAFRVVRRIAKVGGSGSVTLRFTAPKAGRYELRLQVGADRRTLAVRVVR